MSHSAVSLSAAVTAFSEPPLAQSEALPRVPLRAVVSPVRMVPRPAAAPTRPESLPSLEWLRRVASAMLECQHSLRQLQQLRGVVSPTVSEQLGKRRLARLRGQTVSVHSIKASPIRPGVLEVSCTFGSAGGFYPLAFRMELTQTGWLTTACEIGPH